MKGCVAGWVIASSMRDWLSGFASLGRQPLVKSPELCKGYKGDMVSFRLSSTSFATEYI